MTAYTRPGVYVNQSLTPLTASLTGVTGASIACFVGANNTGPTVPTLISSWQTYVNLFGGFKSSGTSLAYAVYQFFANQGNVCYVYRVPNTDAIVADLTVGSTEQTTNPLSPPAAPTVTTADTGGTVAAGTYQVMVTYVTAIGETLASQSTPVTTTGSTSAITITSPVSVTGATGWYAYVSGPGGTASTATRQQSAGVPTAIGTGLTISAPPTSTGLVIPAANTTGSSTPLNAGLLTFTANNPGAWANSLYVEIVPETSGSDGSAYFTLNIYLGGTSPGYLAETWPSVSLNPASSRNLLRLVNATAGGSNYVTAQVSFGSNGYVAGDGSSDPAGNAGSPAALSGGADGTTAPALDTAVTTGISSAQGATYAWHAPGLGSLTQSLINVNLPGETTQTVLNNVITWAQDQGNVFVVIDAPFGGLPLTPSSTLVTEYQQWLSSGGEVITASPDAAVYGPWLSIPDPASSTINATTWVAPGGAVLGVWSRTEAASNISQTPAGVTSTVSAAALEAYFTPTDLSNLETMQVNPIKVVPNSGFCIFGGRTLAVGYPNRYINVSRVLLKFTIDFINITQFAIFQNNDATLWQSITTVLSSYLMQAMQAGMLAGTTPETSYSVTCDATTTSPAQAQAGIVNAIVAVALVSPAEFIIINLSQMQGGGTATVSS